MYRTCRARRKFKHSSIRLGLPARLIRSIGRSGPCVSYRWTSRVRDHRAPNTGWVFGTFAWIGPKRGDGLYDNLMPVALQWGNDKDVFDLNVHESIVNPQLKGVLYDRPGRAWMG